MYATGGRGTEKFIADEILNKLNLNQQKQLGQSSNEVNSNIHIRDGKVFFDIVSDDLEPQVKNILSLKCPERVFVMIKDYDNTDYMINKRIFLNKLMPEMTDSKNYEFAQNVLNQTLKFPKCLDNIKSENETGCIQCGQKRRMTLDDENAELNKKSFMDDDLNSFSNVYEKISNIDYLQQHDRSKKRFKDPSKDCCDINFQQNSSNKVENGFEKSSCDEIAKEDHHIDTKITFRMSIKCSGKARRMLNIERLSRDLAWRVSKASGWTSILRDPLIEVNVHISDSYVTAGIPLTRIPLSKRDYIMDSGLRGPIAWIMYHLSKIKEGDKVLDPMCGKGTLLLEACSEEKNAMYIGVDIDVAQISTAVTNVKNAKFSRYIEFFVGDCKNLPLNQESCDVILCDAPFNQKHAINGHSEQFYLKFLCEIFRVLKRKGRFILLTSETLRKTVSSMLPQIKEQRLSPTEVTEQETTENHIDRSSKFNLQTEHYVKLGETSAYIMVMNKD